MWSMGPILRYRFIAGSNTVMDFGNSHIGRNISARLAEAERKMFMYKGPAEIAEVA